jgi:hypothetical protein
MAGPDELAVRRYQRLAARAFDLLDLYAECRLAEVADTDALRAALRREARTRQLKIGTWANPDKHRVIVYRTDLISAQVANMGISSMRGFVTTYGNSAFENPALPNYIAAGEVTA